MRKKTIRNKALLAELEQYSPTLRVFIWLDGHEYSIADICAVRNGDGKNARLVIETWDERKTKTNKS